jgi:hypothetical protein
VSIKDSAALTPMNKFRIILTTCGAFMGEDKLSSLVTTLLKRTSLLQGSFMEGDRGRSGQTIAGNQDFIPGVGLQGRLLYVRPERLCVQCVVRFSPRRVYTNLNHRDTPGYE